MKLRLIVATQSLLRNARQAPAAPREVLEEKFLAMGLAAMEKQTGKKAPTKVPEWTITSFDVEIGESSAPSP